MLLEWKRQIPTSTPPQEVNSQTKAWMVFSNAGGTRSKRLGRYRQLQKKMRKLLYNSRGPLAWSHEKIRQRFGYCQPNEKRYKRWKLNRDLRSIKGIRRRDKIINDLTGEYLPLKQMIFSYREYTQSITDTSTKRTAEMVWAFSWRNVCGLFTI